MSLLVDVRLDHDQVNGIAQREQSARVRHQTRRGALARSVFVQLEQKALAYLGLARATERACLEALSTKAHVQSEVGHLSLCVTWQHTRLTVLGLTQIVQKGFAVEYLQVEVTLRRVDVYFF